MFNYQDTSAIMKSFNYQSLTSNTSGEESLKDLPDITLNTEYTSLKLEPNSNNCTIGGLLLVDENENLKVSSAESFLRKLQCDEYTKVKVVSIFGNTGDGKSHTLNQTFFRGYNVFRTSEKQDSCTIGAWAAYDPNNKAICIDTEGMLGPFSQESHRTRLLLKILAISDIVIYRTRAERLLSDMFRFIGTASQAYSKHFLRALQNANSEKPEYANTISGFGPSLIIFHETRNTQPLEIVNNESPEEILRGRFEYFKYNLDAFSSIHYVGIRSNNEPTDFGKLKDVIKSELENTSVRSARSPLVIFNTLKILNEKFSDRLVDLTVPLPDQFFTCSVECLSCENRCHATMGHLKEGLPHDCATKCSYKNQFANCIHICQTCFKNGKEVPVTSRVTSSNDTSWLGGLAKYAISGSVIECPNCGEIYRSRQYWYGNKGPEDQAVRIEIQHVWPESNECAIQSQNAAQKVIDGVSYLTEAVANIGAPPAKFVTSWMADKIAPTYWRPNHEIKKCFNCKKEFRTIDSKHHCRACGEGFCEDCSMKTMTVPERGWINPVRVCDTCYASKQDNNDKNEDPKEDEIEDNHMVRKCGEAVISTLSTVASILDYPRELIKDTARPSYWVPDSEVKGCCICDCPLGTTRQPLHHCRDCGKGVCADCSNSRKTVPKRGWDRPVRVCDTCFNKE